MQPLTPEWLARLIYEQDMKAGMVPAMFSSWDELPAGNIEARVAAADAIIKRLVQEGHLVNPVRRECSNEMCFGGILVKWAMCSRCQAQRTASFNDPKCWNCHNVVGVQLVDRPRSAYEPCKVCNKYTSIADFRARVGVGGQP